MAALTADRILSGSESGPYGSMMRMSYILISPLFQAEGNAKTNSLP